MNKVILKCVNATPVYLNKDAICLDNKSIENIKYVKKDLSSQCKVEINKKLNILKSLNEKKEAKNGNEVNTDSDEKENDEIENNEIENNEGLLLSQQISFLLTPGFLRNNLHITDESIKNKSKNDSYKIKENPTKDIFNTFNTYVMKENSRGRTTYLNGDIAIKTKFNKKAITNLKNRKLNISDIEKK